MALLFLPRHHLGAGSVLRRRPKTVLLAHSATRKPSAIVLDFQCRSVRGTSLSGNPVMARAGVAGKVLRQRTGKGRTVRSLSFHSFRHGAATAVFKSAALKDIARRVTAHSSRGVVDRYIHEDIEAIKEATKLIPRLPKA